MPQVQAHGGGLLKVKDTWYWYGESYKRPLLNDFLSEGVNLYSSSGEDQPCTCLLPHMPPLSCGGPPLTIHPGSLSTVAICQAMRMRWELEDDIALPPDPACSSTKLLSGASQCPQYAITVTFTGSAAARAFDWPSMQVLRAAGT